MSGRAAARARKMSRGAERTWGREGVVFLFFFITLKPRVE